MAQEKYAYGSNTGDLFADDDPLAELARIVGCDRPSPRGEAPAQRAEPDFAPAPARTDPAGRAEPVFDLEDELLKEFERYDAPDLDPSEAIPVDEPAAEEWTAFVETVAPRADPSVSGRFTENPVPFPSHERPSVEEERAAIEEAFADRRETSPPEAADEAAFEVDLADELERAVSFADDPATGFAPVPLAEPRSGGFHMPLANFRPARSEPSFAAEPPAGKPAFVEQREPAYDIGHFDSAEVEEAVSDAAFELAEEPAEAAAVAPAAPEPEPPAFDEAVADDEFELALDGLEIDLSDIVLNEVEAAAPAEEVEVAAAASPVAVAPAAAAASLAVAAEAVRPEPVRAAAEALPGGDMPFDASQIAEPDYAPEAIAEMDVPELPVHEAEKPKAYQPAFETDFDAELADLLHDDRTAAKPAETAQPAKSSAVDLDDLSFMMNEDFREEVGNPLGLDRSPGPLVIDPDNMEVIEPEERNRVRGWAIAAVASVAVLASATGLYAWLNSGGVSGFGGDGPPIVLADPDPVKVVPENPGGKTVPNQDKAVYDRVAGASPQAPTQRSLISSSEEPLDVVQRTLTPENFPLERAEEDYPADAQDERLVPVTEPETAAADNAPDANVSLRKVRTMIVRPDGTLVAREVPESMPAAQPAGQQPSQTQTAVQLPASSGAPAPTETAPLRTEPTATAPAVSDEALSQAAASSVTETRAAPPAATNRTTGDRAPVPVQRPAEQPVNIVGTVTGQGNVRQASGQTQTPVAQAPAAPQEVASAQPAAAPAVPAGSYVVQIASLPSQADAERSYRNMSSKYASVIGGRPVDIRAADIPGKGTYYRVRIVAGGKDEANALCGRLKAAGGSCLVTR